MVLRKHRTYYQYYTNVTYLTCADCLAWHGKILSNAEGFPNRNDDCERKILPFSGGKLKEYREKERRMRARANAELERRELFSNGKALLGVNDDQAVELLAKTTQVDVYIPELEELYEDKGSVLEENRGIKEKLRKLFAKAYSDKFGWPRYELLPEPMRIARERAGIKRINELFG